MDAQERIEWTSEEWRHWPHPYPRRSLLVPMAPADRGPLKVAAVRRHPGRTPTVTNLVMRIRRCSICHEWKPFGEFSPNAGKPYGITYFCRLCDQERR